MVTDFEKVMFNVRKCRRNRSKRKIKVGPWNLAMKFESIFRTVAKNLASNCIRFSAKPKGSLSLSPKMLKLCLCIAVIVITAISACERHEWRGRIIECSRNGTKFERNGEVFWSQSKPLFCGPSMELNSATDKDTTLITVIKFVGCCLGICCGLHFLYGFCLFKLFWK